MHFAVPGVSREDQTIRMLPTRLTGAWFTPESLKDKRKDETATILYLHGGGFVAGSVDTHDTPVRELAKRTQCRIFSLEYHRVQYCTLHPVHIILSPLISYF